VTQPIIYSTPNTLKMSIFLSEFIGTMVVLIFGSGVVANVVLNKSKGKDSGWIVITFGWAIGVFCGVMIAAPGSGAHLNPAVTLSFAYLGRLDPSLISVYVAAQFLGAFVGSGVVWLAYHRHFDATEDPVVKLAIFSTIPAIRHPLSNLVTEIIGTYMLILGVLFITAPTSSLGALDALPVALLVLGIGLSLGGPTGYAINPARDLGPRLMHALLPIKGKGGSDWSYSWVPLVGPLVGGLLAAITFQTMLTGG
jgi:glycerol uptake facilitator protein